MEQDKIPFAQPCVKTRKRPLPPSNSSKGSNTVVSSCPMPSLSSSMTTASLSGGNKKRRRHAEEGAAAYLEQQEPQKPQQADGASSAEEQNDQNGRDGNVGSATAGSPTSVLTKIKREDVRRVEYIVLSMFTELDVLLHAEDINRRVMYRWSGAGPRPTCAGGPTTYCTWGRELIKQHVDDAVESVRTIMAAHEYSSAIEAAHRLTLLYASKSIDRSIVEIEPSLHSEMMTLLGNLWFALLPHTVQNQRLQLRRLIGKLHKMRIGGGINGGLVIPLRCLLRFARLDLSIEAIEKKGSEAVKMQLEKLIDADTYDCDAHTCLWWISEILAGLTGFGGLCQKYRLRSLDAQLWRGMLAEEQELKERFGQQEDLWDSEVDSEEDSLDDRIVEDEEFEDKDAIAEERVDVRKAPFRCGTPQHDMGVPPPLTEKMQPADPSACETGEQNGLATTALSGWLGYASGTSPSPPVQARSPARSAEAVANQSVNWSEMSAERRLIIDEKALVGAKGNRARAAEMEDVDQCGDFMSLKQHEYRRAITPEFVQRLWTFLRGCQPCNLEGGQAGDESHDEIIEARLFFTQARPFLYRLVSLLPPQFLPTYLDLLSDKFGYVTTLRLLQPTLTTDTESLCADRLSLLLDWLVDYKQGSHLAELSQHLLPQLHSRLQVESLTRRALRHGHASLPLVDHVLHAISRTTYESTTLSCLYRALNHWGPHGGAHLIVLRALQGLPSLGLYLKCRGCFLDPVNFLVKPLIHEIGYTSEISIGIRLVEGMVASAVHSIVTCLSRHPSNTPEQQHHAQQWADFSLAGVRGGQFPPSLIDRLFSTEPFLLALLAIPSNSEDSTATLQFYFSRVSDLSRTHGDVCARPLEALSNCLIKHGAKTEQQENLVREMMSKVLTEGSSSQLMPVLA